MIKNWTGSEVDGIPLAFMQVVDTQDQDGSSFAFFYSHESWCCKRAYYFYNYV